MSQSSDRQNSGPATAREVRGRVTSDESGGDLSPLRGLSALALAIFITVWMPAGPAASDEPGAERVPPGRLATASATLVERRSHDGNSPSEGARLYRSDDANGADPANGAG